MIMLAVALNHYKKKNCAGTSKLLEKGIKLLKANTEAKIDIDREKYLKEADSFRNKFTLSKKDLSEEDFPRIHRLSNI